MKTNLAYILLASGSLLLGGCATQPESRTQIQPIGVRYRIITGVDNKVQAEKIIELRGNTRKEETRYQNEP